MEVALVWRSAPVLGEAVVQTMLLSASSAVLAVIVGTIVAEITRLNSKVTNFVLARYVDTVRGVPPLVLIFLVFYLLPIFGIQTAKFGSATIALGIYFSGYVAEVLRGSLMSVPSGQIQAAQAMGMVRWQVETIVIIPQALRVALPALVNLSSILIKMTSLASIIGVWELTLATKEMVSRTLQPFEFFLTAMLLYFVVCYTLVRLSRRLEAKLNRGS